MKYKVKEYGGKWQIMIFWNNFTAATIFKKREIKNLFRITNFDIITTDMIFSCDTLEFIKINFEKHSIKKKLQWNTYPKIIS